MSDPKLSQVNMSPYWALAVAIVAEVVATTTFKATHAFTKPLASAVVIASYALAFYALSLAIKTIPVGVAYGIWSGLGIVLVSVSAWFFLPTKPHAQPTPWTVFDCVGGGVGERQNVSRA